MKRSGKAAIMLTGVLACGAAAQWDPGASQQLGMGHGFTALSQSTMGNAMQREDDEADGAAVQRMAVEADDARLAALALEYARRVRRDGREQADAWAFSMGRRDALSARD